MKNNKMLTELEYNTQLEELIMPEYGRNVQRLVRHAQKIENAEVRQAFCEEIVTLIQQLYPQSKSIEDYREKLWKHLFHIAKYKLDARTPSGEVPRLEDAKKRPGRVPYPPQESRYRHYGNNINILIRKAVDMPPGPIKEGFVNTIGSYMKLSYKTWNREHFVADEIIKNDLTTISKGKLSLEDTSRLDGLAMASRSRTIQNVNNKDSRGRSGTQNRNDGRNDTRNDGRNNDRRDNRPTNNNNPNNNRNSPPSNINNNNRNNKRK